MKRTDYITIQAPMVTDLKLSGNNLIIFALIHGFCKDGNHKFTGSLEYVSEWTNLSKPTIIATLKLLVKNGLINKEENIVNNVKFCSYTTNYEENIANVGGGKESLPVLKKYKCGSKESLMGSKESLPNNINDIDINKDIKEDTKKDDLFEDCWKSYRRKGSKAESRKEWVKLTEEEKKQVKEHIPYYVSSQSEKTYQKDFERYLKKKIFNNVVYKGNTTLYDPEQINNVGEYRPKLDGFNLRWIESENCYMTPFDFSMLIDGYSADDRPSSAVVMYNGIKYQWDTKLKEWRKL